MPNMSRIESRIKKIEAQRTDKTALLEKRVKEMERELAKHIRDYNDPKYVHEPIDHEEIKRLEEVLERELNK